MERDNETSTTTQLHQPSLDERSLSAEQLRVNAAEAYHRQRLLTGNKPCLEDLAGEWIELIRANSRKTTG